MTATTQDSPPVGADTVRPTIAPRTMLNKVPEVTLYFWIIKILCTTVGETAADFLADNLGLGLTVTTFVMSGVLVVSLAAQFHTRRYVPGIYWLAVVLISIVGTLITDNLTDNFGISLVADDYCLQHRPRTHLRRLVPERTNALDPHDRHDKERGVLLARRPLHLRTRDRRGGSGRRTLRHRLPAIGAFVRRPHRCRLRPPRPVRARRRPRVLDRLHPHPATRGIDRRLPVPAPGRRWARTRHDRHERALPHHDPRRCRVLTITKKDQTERRT